MAERTRRPRIPLISEHDTWISVDPIIGCPANCRYCYLGPLDLQAKRPEQVVTPHALANAVEFYLEERAEQDPYGRLAGTPVCFGNYTDTFMSSNNIDYFTQYAELHARRFPSHPLCVVTKARLAHSDLLTLDALGHPLIVFLSQSFLGRLGGNSLERGPTSRPEDTTRSLSLFAGLVNVRPVHFLRPVVGRNVSAPERAVEILRQVRDAGSIATVAVGLKLGPGVRLSPTEYVDLVGAETAVGAGLAEYFPEQARTYLLDAARSLSYPLYFHTSCAVALATGTPEALGTWREPLRTVSCAPCNCPEPQRLRCDAERSEQGDASREEIASLCPRYGLPGGSMTWVGIESAVHLKSMIGQYSFNRIVHALPYRVLGRSVQPEEAWLGTFVQDQQLLANRAEPYPGGELDLRPSDFGHEMYQAADRLRKITGFVTVLHNADDARAKVFARYYHVRRVVWLVKWLMRQRSGYLDPTRVLWLAWAHDLNRWPFAHNAERGRFDQAADVARYLAAMRIHLPVNAYVHAGDPAGQRSILGDLEGIISKNKDELSPEGRVVLLADIVAGLIEDPLLAVTGLDVGLDLIPGQIGARLCLPFGDPSFRRRLLDLNLLLYSKRDVEGFVAGFDAVFRARACSFINRYSMASTDPLGEGWFADLKTTLKEGFLRQTIFPYNNEKVAHGLRLRSEIIEPLLRELGPGAAEQLTTVTEDGVLALAAKREIIGRDSKDRYLPDLDYMEEHEPGRSFRLTAV